ncbi:YggS family pyridoxal phosphate-dependent enzyme [Mariniblastus fucicola]|uniref:Pyridoxal phosphate homeostasis protein n=1 Tax=Mariniblastus fucicola TaxID=980251 RepID=A0A5B9P917_9BACT|nr:YggS family pyridoxal phosphate-dependent enzyme [Mariniblastus fucicola]QEG23237.1 Pyridoxal phosphate homeostasis protein [Mariniblastus fucicola]
MEDNFKTRLAEVRQRIADAAQRSGRNAGDVTLVAVTKYVDAATTRELFNAGATVLGENRPQVLEEKARQLSDLDIEWHMIGNLQRNKVKRTLAHATLIHALDRDSLIDAVAKEAAAQDKTVRCLLEVNVSGEESKHGFSADEVASAIERIVALPSIRLEGLMCMAGLAGDENDARGEFALLREIRDAHSDVQTDNVALRELSMGMSGDFEIAIEEGATIVRVGSALYR